MRMEEDNGITQYKEHELDEWVGDESDVVDDERENVSAMRARIENWEEMEMEMEGFEGGGKVEKGEEEERQLFFKPFHCKFSVVFFALGIMLM